MFRQTLKHENRRKGAVFVFALVMLIVLLGFGSLTLDVGAMYNTRADLQNAADAAALAGASLLTEEIMIPIRQGTETSTAEIKRAIYERAAAVAARVTSFGGKSVHLEPEDVVVGWIDRASATSRIDVSQPASKYNAVHVIARRTSTSTNGPVQLFFASIFGKPTADVTASATAAFDDSVSGIILESAPTLFPFSVQDTTWDELLARNRDNYQFHEMNERVTSGSDGIAELDIYPSTLAPGNFGRLAIGSADVENQILYGVSAADLQLEVGTSNLTFVDDNGEPVAYQMTGDTGTKVTLEAEIGQRIGDIVALPIHSTVKKSGNNAVFSIIAVRFVRVMAVNLRGKNKAMWLQPVTYTGEGVITNPNAPSSGGNGGLVVLVR